MEYKSDEGRLPTDPNNEHTGNNLTEEQRKAIHALLDDGVGTGEIATRLGHSKHTIIAVRRAREDASGGLNLNSWKKATAATMAAIVAKGSTRLLAEIENIPPGQLPLALAIMTDKVLALQDAPAVVVEHRLRVSHDDINKMIKGEVIDLPPSKSEEPA